jgi:hypothetical protein
MDVFLRDFQSNFNVILSKEMNDIDIKIQMGKRVIAVGHDSKLVSKILESFVIVILVDYCNKHEIKFQENDIQNKYPDFVMFYEDRPIAIDIKTSYSVKEDTISGFTLGTQTH